MPAIDRRLPKGSIAHTKGYDAVGHVESHSYVVIGVRADGDEVVLDGDFTSKAAELRARVYRRWLDDYVSVRVDPIKFTDSRIRRRMQG